MSNRTEPEDILSDLLTLRFISNGEWFDKNTEAKLICLTGTGRINSPSGPRSASGLFRGYKDGELDEETCCLTEFEIVTEDYFSWGEAKNIKRIK